MGSRGQSRGVVLAAAMLAAGAATMPRGAWGQASAIPSAAAPAATAEGEKEKGAALLEEMVDALGGDSWLVRHDAEIDGKLATFFHGQPNPGVIHFKLYHQFADGSHPEGERIEFATPRMLLHGEIRDIVQVWTTDNGYEITFKGKTPLPKEQVEDYLRRRAHSIENVMRTWVKQPGVMIVYEGPSMVDRHLTDKVTVLSANNDAVTIELDQTTHLPLSRSFRWRNTTFKDYDEDVETYDDYHPVQGMQTALTITRYRNGDMANQRFYTKVTYNQGLSQGLFNPDNLLKKK